MPNSSSRTAVPLISGMLSASQAEEPEKLYDVLATTAVKESWIILLIHFHTAIFFGLILLASGYDEFTSLIYLAIHLSASLLCGLMLVFLIRQTAEQLVHSLGRTIIGLTVVDALISLSWGISILLFFNASNYDEVSTLVVLLLAAGISSAALSAKLLHILIVGRVLVFLPTILFLIALQPPDWILHSTSLVLSFGVCVGVGYAIHVQLLREASLVVELGATQARIVDEAELRERFLRSITHDLRQPLASLGLHARALGRNTSSPEISSEVTAIGACLDSANEIMQSVSQLAWVSDSLPPAKIEVIDLWPLIQRVVETSRPLAESKGLEISYVKTSLSALADESYLERALRNLVDNAIEHTQSGKILVGVRNRLSAQAVELQVVDTGEGISKADQEKVFEVYQRLDSNVVNEAGHLGLGLYIVDTLITAMGGQVKLRSESGAGSCFGLQLQAVQIKGGKNTYSPVTINSVLLVDDDPEYAAQLEGLIKQLNIRCLSVTEPDAIEELFQDGLPMSDCYLIDYHLSSTRTGLDLLTLAPVDSVKLLISNFDTPQLRYAAANMAVEFVHKPAGRENIEHVLTQFLAGKKA